MTISVVHVDNTALANRDVQGTTVDNSKSLININEGAPIGDAREDTNCIVAVCEKQPNVFHNPDVGEHNTKDVDLDGEKDLVRTHPYKANNVKGTNTFGDSIKENRMPFKNTKGCDTYTEVEGSHSGNAVQRTIDNQCQANDGDGCYLESTDHRKVVSQYFGRNKRCTQLLTDDLWLVWCRKHYQQRRYNLQQEGIWHLKKLELIRIQMERFKDSDRIAGWDIALHKTERIRLDREDAAAVIPEAKPPASPVWERFLKPYLGCNQSYEQVDAVLRVIEAEFQSTAFVARENKDKEMPAIEFLPIFPKGIADKPLARTKHRALIPHVKARGKPPTSKSSSQTMTPEFIDKTATTTITQTIDTVPVSPSSPCKRKASSSMSLDEDSKKCLGYLSSSRPDKSPLTSAPNAVSTSILSQRKRQDSSPNSLDNVLSEYPNKRRRLVQGIRPKTVHPKTEGFEE